LAKSNANVGVQPFELGVENEEQEAIKAQAKLEREDEVFIEGIEKKKAKIKKLRSMTQEEKKAYRDSIRATMPAYTMCHIMYEMRDFVRNMIRYPSHDKQLSSIALAAISPRNTDSVRM
jgi:hypothetical protein